MKGLFIDLQKLFKNDELQYSKELRKYFTQINLTRIHLLSFTVLGMLSILFFVDLNNSYIKNKINISTLLLIMDIASLVTAVIFNYLSSPKFLKEKSSNFKQLIFLSFQFLFISYAGIIASLEYLMLNSYYTLIVCMFVFSIAFIQNIKINLITNLTGMALFFICSKILNNDILEVFLLDTNLISLLIFCLFLSRVFYLNRKSIFISSLNLKKNNKSLKQEICEKEKAQKELAKYQEKLEEKITAIKQELEEKNNTLKNIIDHSTNLFYSHDTDHNLFYVSPQVEEILGYTEDEAMRKWTDMATDHPQNKTAFDYTMKAIETGKRQPTYELQLQKKSGEKIWVEVREAPLVENDQTIALVGSLTDITNRKTAESENQRRIQIEQAITEISASFIGNFNFNKEVKTLLAKTGKLCQAARSYIFNIDFVNKTYNNTFEWCNEGVKPEIDNLQGIPISVAPWWITKFEQGKRVYIEDVDKLSESDTELKEALLSQQIKSLIAFPIIVRGNLTGFMGFDNIESVRDWTETDIRTLELSVMILQNVLERDLAEKDKEKLLKISNRAQKMESIGILAGGIAHDFNNLLSIVIGNASYAAMLVKGDEKLKEILEDIEEGAKRASDLTRQLLTFSKGGEPVKKIKDINKLLKDAASFSARGSNCKIIFNLEKNLPTTLIDYGQIHQVINNIIINAIQAMPKGGNITVSTKHISRQNQILMSIEDQGIGISEDILDNIFDPYFTTKQMGNGLGLATCYSIIEKHGGSINASSKLGKGTVFTILLPVSETNITEQPAEDKEVPLAAKGKILVLDDEKSIHIMIKRMLNHLGYKVETFTESEKTIKAYQESLSHETYDAVILDLTIPGQIGGKEVCQEILNIDKNAICIVSSGYSNDPVIANYQNYGFKGVLPKPYTKKEIFNTLKEVLHGK